MKNFLLATCSAVILSCGAATDSADAWGGLKRVDECGGNESAILSTDVVTPEQQAAYKELVARIKDVGTTHLNPDAVKTLVGNLDYVGIPASTMDKAFAILTSDDFVATMSPIQLALLPVFLMKMPKECKVCSTTKESLAEPPPSWRATYQAALAHANAYFAHVFYLQNVFNNRASLVELSDADAAKHLDVATLLLSIGHNFGLLWHRLEYQYRFAAAILDQYIMPAFKEVAPGTEKAKLFDIIKKGREEVRQKADVYYLSKFLEETRADAEEGSDAARCFDGLSELLPMWLGLATQRSRSVSDSRLDPGVGTKFDRVWGLFDIMHKGLEEARGLVPVE